VFCGGRRAGRSNITLMLRPAPLALISSSSTSWRSRSPSLMKRSAEGIRFPKLGLLA
jgi:hypothetical protein